MVVALVSALGLSFARQKSSALILKVSVMMSNFKKFPSFMLLMAVVVIGHIVFLFLFDMLPPAILAVFSVFYLLSHYYLL
jgi:hypothetical protein